MSASRFGHRSSLSLETEKAPWVLHPQVAGLPAHAGVAPDVNRYFASLDRSRK